MCRIIILLTIAKFIIYKNDTSSIFCKIFFLTNRNNGPENQPLYHLTANANVKLEKHSRQAE